MVAAICFNSIAFWGWSVWLPTYLKTTRHFTFSRAGYLTFVIYGCATLTIIVMGLLSDRIFRWALSGVFLLTGTWSRAASAP